MRAATVIVGAIAAASVMIALALILSGGDAGKGGTTTIEKIVEAPEEPTKSEGAAQEEAGDGGGGLQYGGPRPCGTGEVSVKGASCQVGEQVHTEYETGHPGDIFVKDEETGSTLTFICKGAGPVTCTGEKGEVVYFGS